MTDHGNGHGTALLQLRGVTKRFPVGRGLSRASGGSRWLTAVDDVTLDVAANETFAVVGETGCGKSTLARLMVRLMPLTSGSVADRRPGHHERPPQRAAPAAPGDAAHLPGLVLFPEPAAQRRLDHRRACSGSTTWSRALSGGPTSSTSWGSSG